MLSRCRHSRGFCNLLEYINSFFRLAWFDLRGSVFGLVLEVIECVRVFIGLEKFAVGLGA